MNWYVYMLKSLDSYILGRALIEEYMRVELNMENELCHPKWIFGVSYIVTVLR